MGEIELNGETKVLFIRSVIITYGEAATTELTEQIREEIETMWNEPEGEVEIKGEWYKIRFIIHAQLQKEITDLDIYRNVNPQNNYFRIEEYAYTNISFVDALGCNSGYFKLENLYKGSTTAAHEYGHTLGLAHPENLDIRGTGTPGIMYPRGTLVDPPFQYDPTKPAGVTGGTLHPMYRKVLPSDIRQLHLHRLRFDKGKAVIGEFTNVYHWNHAKINQEDIMEPPIAG